MLGGPPFCFFEQGIVIFTSEGIIYVCVALKIKKIYIKNPPFPSLLLSRERLISEASSRYSLFRFGAPQGGFEYHKGDLEQEYKSCRQQLIQRDWDEGTDNTSYNHNRGLWAVAGKRNQKVLLTAEKRRGNLLSPLCNADWRRLWKGSDLNVISELLCLLKWKMKNSDTVKNTFNKYSLWALVQEGWLIQV